MVAEDDNVLLSRLPDSDEVKRAILNLNGDSALGPNGFTGRFYQSCWEIVGGDTIRMVHDFFSDISLPKSITDSNLVLIPKKN